MGRAKDILLKVIPSREANAFVKRWHYSGKVVNNSQLHFGAFLDGRLHGVMSFGPPLDKRKVLGLVKGTLWNEMLELNRMAFDEFLPKNSESRCISISVKLLRKHAPQVKWILSFSDATQCGDGAIYRAAGFVLTDVKKNSAIYTDELGNVYSSATFSKAKYSIANNGAASSSRALSKIGATKASGYQLRYIYLIDKTCKLTCTILPFSKIDELGAGMYKGERITLAERQQPHAAVAHRGERRDTNPEGAFDSTLPLKK